MQGRPMSASPKGSTPVDRVRAFASLLEFAGADLGEQAGRTGAIGHDRVTRIALAKNVDVHVMMQNKRGQAAPRFTRS